MLKEVSGNSKMSSLNLQQTRAAVDMKVLVYNLTKRMNKFNLHVMDAVLSKTQG